MSAQTRYGASRRSCLEPLVGGVLVLLDGVPLVEHQHDALAGLEHVAHDVGVLRGVALGRIGQDDRDVGRVDRLHAAQDAVALDPALDAPRRRMPAVSTRTIGCAVELDGGVDRIAGRARHVGRRSCAPRRGPGSRRSTCRCSGGPRSPPAAAPISVSASSASSSSVRSLCRPMQTDAAASASARRREVVDDEVGEVAGVAAVLRADRDRRVEAEGVELDRIGLARGVVALVDDEDHRRVGASQPIGDLVVERRQAGVRRRRRTGRGRPPRPPPAPGPAPAPRCASPARARGRRCRPP